MTAPSPRKNKWVTITRRMPESLAQVIFRAEAVAIQILKLTDNLPSSPKARTLAVLELIYSDFLLGNETMHRDVWAMAKDEGGEMFRAKLECLERDGWLCRLCGHSKANTGVGALNAHHIYPRSYHGPDRPWPIHDPRNLATLCSDCHAKVHAEGWRKYVAQLTE